MIFWVRNNNFLKECGWGGGGGNGLFHVYYSKGRYFVKSFY